MKRGAISWLLLWVILSAGINDSFLLAEEKPQKSENLPIFSIFQSKTEPIQASAIVVQDGKGPQEYSATVHPSETSQGIWYVAASIERPQLFNSISYCFLVKSGDGLLVTPLRKIEEVDPVLDDRELAEEVNSLKAGRLKIQNELQARERELKKLRSDVGQYADLERILILRDERRSLENSIESLVQEEVVLKESLQAFQDKQIPGSYRAYEISLMRSLSALNSASSKLKSQVSSQRKGRSDREDTEN